MNAATLRALSKVARSLPFISRIAMLGNQHQRASQLAQEWRLEQEILAAHLVISEMRSRGLNEKADVLAFQLQVAIEHAREKLN
jgi:hypothetical protein